MWQMYSLFKWNWPSFNSSDYQNDPEPTRVRKVTENLFIRHAVSNLFKYVCVC